MPTISGGMDFDQYLRMLAKNFASELGPILSIDQVTSNTDLLGSFTEAAVKRLVRRSIEPMRVCTGAVLDFPLPPKLRQIDLIIWAPAPAPAVFDMEGFGLVPRSSAFGVLEIKKSNYKGVDTQLEEFIDDAINHRIVADGPTAPVAQQRCAGLGVICVLERKISKRLANLFGDGHAIALFERQNGEPVVRDADVIRLINFLYFVTWRHRAVGGSATYPQVALPAET